MWFFAFILSIIFFGPVGAVLWFICFWIFVINDSPPEQDNRPQFTPASQQEPNISTIELLSPLIDILCTYALKYETYWVSEKVRFIKSLFEGLCETSRDEEFLKERLKAKYRRPLSSLIPLWLDLNPNLVEKHNVLQAVIVLMLQTCPNFETAQSESIEFGKSIGLDEYDCYLRFTKKAQEYSHFHQNANHQYQEEIREEIDDIQWARETLGVSKNATQEEIQKAYRLKIKEFHPDRNRNVSATVQEMLETKTKELNRARDILLQYAV